MKTKNKKLLCLRMARHATLEIGLLRPPQSLLYNDFFELTLVWFGRRMLIMEKPSIPASTLANIEKLFGQLLRGELRLHPSITDDIGYLWNEYQRRDRSVRDERFVEEEESYGKFWVGGRYWTEESLSLSWTTWLYERDGRLFLEVTPSYHRYALLTEESPEFIPYSEFIKDYAPLLILELDREMVRESYERLVPLNRLAEKNEARICQQRCNPWVAEQKRRRCLRVARTRKRR